VKGGKWSGGIVPYGYRKTPESFIEINEDVIPGTQMPEAEVVRMIYRWAAQRQSTLAIARKLNETTIRRQLGAFRTAIQKGTVP